MLGTLPVLHKGLAGRNDGAEWSWPVWFERLGVTAPVQAGLRFDNLGTAITAALQGSGVVLARSLLVHDALAEKRLCRVVSPDWDMTCSKAHVIRWPAALASDRRVARFADWVVKEAETNIPSVKCVAADGFPHQCRHRRGSGHDDPHQEFLPKILPLAEKGLSSAARFH